MKYKVVIHFKDNYDEVYTVDGYSHATCVLALFNYNETTSIKLFPLEDLKSVDITQIGV